MTHYYYDSKANKFYGPLGKMPPDKNDYFGFMGEDEVFDVESYDNDIESFLRYLSSAPSIPHTFSGHSRIVPEGEIEWRYEVAWRNPDGTITGWKECEDMFHYEQQPYQYRRRVATPKITAQPDKQTYKYIKTVEVREYRKDIFFKDNDVYLGYIYPEAEGDWVFASVEDNGGVWPWYVLEEIAALTKVLSRASAEPIPIYSLSDEHAVEIYDIIGGPTCTDEAKASHVKDLLTTNRFYTAQTNITGEKWNRIFEYLNFKGYKAHHLSPPSPQQGEKVHRIIIEGNWYPAECNSCGWIGSSQYLEGCHAIADTGDHSDPLCPICGSKDIDSTEELHDLQSLVSKLGKAHVAAKYFRENYERVAEELYVSQHQPPPAQSDQEAAVAFAEWIIEKGYKSPGGSVWYNIYEEKETLINSQKLYALFTARHPTPKPGSQEGGKHL